MWDKAQEFEKSWWGTCANTLGEELKQLVYADRMGIQFTKRDGIPFIIDVQGKTILDVGGGPNSLLLKMENGKGIVVDPCDYPKWVADRYWMVNIECFRCGAEDLADRIYASANEAWCYNVLQHVKDPEAIIKKMKLAGKIRIFEWIESETNGMHPHSFTQAQLENWLGAKGKVEEFNGINECYGKAFYGEI